VKNLDMIYLEN